MSPGPAVYLDEVISNYKKGTRPVAALIGSVLFASILAACTPQTPLLRALDEFRSKNSGYILDETDLFLSVIPINTNESTVLNEVQRSGFIELHPAIELNGPDLRSGVVAIDYDISQRTLARYFVANVGFWPIAWRQYNATLAFQNQSLVYVHVTAEHQTITGDL